jgi:PAS domain S-box-containing protein
VKNQSEAKEQLVKELAEMRQRVAELEASEAERQKVEEALKESERRYRELADLLPQIVFEMDLEGNITFMNRNGLDFLGYIQEDLEAGLNAIQLVIPEDRERIGKNLQKTFAGEKTGGIQYTGLRKDGSTFPFIGDSSLTIREDKPVGLRGIVIDITERVRAEEALERRVAELRALNAMATIVNESLEVDEILNRAMDEALQQVGVEAAAMLLLDEEAGELALVAHRGLSDQFVRTFRRMKLGEGLAGQVAETGQPSILRDLTEYPEALRSYVEAEKIQSAASVPLMGRTGVIGVMNLGATSPHYFDAAGLELLVALGRQISTGVEKARLSQETFRVVAENASDGIFVTAGEGAQVYANQRAAEITGYSIAELLKSTIKDLVHPDELGKIMERYRKRLAGEPVPRQYETIIVRKDGKSVPIELTAAKTVWRGQPADMVIIRDTTTRKQAEEALRESEERYRSLFESTREGIIISGPDGKISSVNPATVAILGYENREEIVGRPAVEFYADPEERKAVFEELMEKGYVTDVEVAVKKGDGTQAYALASFTIHKDREGNLLRAEAVFRDITERKRAEQALQESEERLSSFMESATDGFVLYDSGLNLVEINKAALGIFPPGTKKEDIIGKNMLDISPGLKETGRHDRYLEVTNTGKPFFADDLVPHPRFGDRHLAVKAFKVSEGLGIVFADITERKRVEEALAQRVEELERFHRLAVGRELRMIELKRQVNELSEQLGKEPPYDLSLLE